MDQADALELLQASHTFPGPFRFRVVARAGSTPAVLSAVSATLGRAVDDITEKPSRNGTYISVRIETTVHTAQEVLDTYAVLQAMEHVLATL
ncbi:MAG: DUF493 domain-containing protein [Myxococcota bacterium]